ncbi:hypothetical protein FHG87_011158 [Trinorchestia longiramus]|nr:hypothetical protein FHG87_011158 [Trinorchestia longiramus]
MLVQVMESRRMKGNASSAIPPASTDPSSSTTSTAAPLDASPHTANTAIFFSLSLSLFAIVGVVLFVRRCVRWPAAGGDLQTDTNTGFRRSDFGSTDDCSAMTTDPPYDPATFYNSPFSVIPYDYADIDDYKFIQTPTSPTPSSTPGVNARKPSRFNPHLAHLAGFNFRKESCGSCHSKNRQSRENLHKDVRYFCKNCRMLHRYEDAIGRSCNSLAPDATGSISSCLDKKAFYYTPTHIHLAIISAKGRKMEEIEKYKSLREFSSRALHDTKSESNLAKSLYTSKTDLPGRNPDIFSPNPRRKISDICSHSMDAEREFETPRKARSSISTIYSPNVPHRTDFRGDSSQPSCSYDMQYSSQFDLESQSSVDYPSMTCLETCREERSEIEKRLMSHRSDSQFDLVRDDCTPSRVHLPPNSRRRTFAQERGYNSHTSQANRYKSNCSRQPLSPRLIEGISQSSALDCVSLRSQTFSYDMPTEDECSYSNSLASSISSLHPSPSHSLSRPSSSRCPSLYHLADAPYGQAGLGRMNRRPLPYHVRTRSTDLSDVIPVSSCQDVRSIGKAHDTSLWYSMTSVNTMTDDECCYEEQDEDEDDDDDDDDEDQITVAERNKKTPD